MPRGAAAILSVLALLASGCTDGADSGPSPVYGLELDAIVPGRFAVSNTTDYILVWVHNTGNTQVDVSWNLTGAGRGPLPNGWRASFGRDETTLAPKGTKQPTANGYIYPDWDWTLLTLNVPRNTTSGPRMLELWAGGNKTDLNVTVRSLQYPVAKIGAKVKTHIEGRFEDSNEVFQPETDFDLDNVGGQGTIPGFSAGHIGLAKLEEVVLRLPPALGYGYDQHNLAGRTLLFKVKIIAGV